MYLLSSLIIILSLHCTCVQAEENRVYRDPFTPLYITDPINEYERQLAEKTQYQNQADTLPDMYICNSTDDKQKRSVMFNGVLYYEGDRYLNGKIAKIDCDHVKIESESTTILLRLYEDRIVSRSRSKKT